VKRKTLTVMLAAMLGIVAAGIVVSTVSASSVGTGTVESAEPGDEDAVLALANEGKGDPACNTGPGTHGNLRTNPDGSYTWVGAEATDRLWYPQGIGEATYQSQPVKVISWYHRTTPNDENSVDRSRVTIIYESGSKKGTYEHIELRDQNGGFVKSHAGGVAVRNNVLYVASTNVLRAFDFSRPHDFGNAKGTGFQELRSFTPPYRETQHDVRFSSISFDRQNRLLVAEFNRDAKGEINRYTIDRNGFLIYDGKPLGVGEKRVQGIAEGSDGNLYLTQSNGASSPGKLFRSTYGGTLNFTEVNGKKLPSGPEDLARGSDGLWTLTEYPCHRHILRVL